MYGNIYDISDEHGHRLGSVEHNDAPKALRPWSVIRAGRIMEWKEVRTFAQALAYLRREPVECTCHDHERGWHATYCPAEPEYDD